MIKFYCKSIAACLLVLIGLMPVGSLAQTVRFVNAATGNDANTGLTMAQAYATIGAAVASLPATGGYLRISGGTYNETVDVDRKVGFRAQPSGTGVTTVSITRLNFNHKARWLVATTDVNTGTEQIDMGASHNLVVNDSLLYMKGTGTVIGGLTNGTIYRVAAVSGNLITLKTTTTATVINLTSTGTGVHQFVHRPQHLNTSAATVSVNTDGDLTFPLALVATGGNFNIAAGTFYYYALTLSRSMTVTGAGMGSTILTGGTAASTTCITPGTGINNITISDLSIDNYTNGVYRNTSSPMSNHTLRNLNISTISNYGIGYDNGGAVHSITIDNCTISGCTGSAGRGIMFQSMTKTNLVITNNTISNCRITGIDISSGGQGLSGAIITGNTITGTAATGQVVDCGISVYQTGTEPADSLAKYPILVADNTITIHGRFGMELKGSRGNGQYSGGGSYVCRGNKISHGGSPLTGAAATEVRDIAGICLGNLQTASRPSGVIVAYNTVSGFAQSAAQYTYPTTENSTGFGIVASGLNHKIHNNVVSSCNVGIQVQRPLSTTTGAATASNMQNACGDNYFNRDYNGAVLTSTVESDQAAIVSFNSVTGNSIPIRVVGQVVVNASGNYFGSTGSKTTDPQQVLVVTGITSSSPCTGLTLTFTPSNVNTSIGQAHQVCWAKNNEAGGDVTVAGFQSDFVVGFRDTATWAVLGRFAPPLAVVEPFADLASFAWAEKPRFVNGVSVQRAGGSLTFNGLEVADDSALGITATTTLAIAADTVDVGQRGKVSGTGNLSLATGAVFQSANGCGVCDSVLTVTGTVDWSIEPRFALNGTYAQASGLDMPEDIYSLTVNNGKGVTLSNDLNLAGTLYLHHGHLDISAAALGILGTITGSDSLLGGPGAGLIIGGTTGGGTGEVRFKEAGRELALLTMARSGTDGHASLGTSVDVTGVIANTAGYLDLNGHRLTISGTGLGASFAVGGGPDAGTASGEVEYTGAGDLVPALIMQPGAARLSKLIVNSAAGSIKLGSTMILGDSLLAQAGELRLNGNQLNMAGVATFGTGYLVGDAAAQLNFTGTGESGALVFSSDSAESVLSKLIVNRDGQGTLGSRVIVADSLKLLQGRLGFTAPSFTLAGFATANGGVIYGNSNTNLVVRGGNAGTLAFDADSSIMHDLLLDLTDSLRLASDFTVGGQFDRTAGVLDSKTSLLTLAGSQTNTAAIVKPGSDCRLRIAGSGTFGILPFPAGYQEVRDLIIARNGTAEVQGDLTIQSQLDMQAGSLILENNTLRIIGEALANGGSITGGTPASVKGIIEIGGVTGGSAGSLGFNPAANRFRSLRVTRSGGGVYFAVTNTVLFRDTIAVAEGQLITTGTGILHSGQSDAFKGTLVFGTDAIVVGRLARWISGTNTAAEGFYPMGNSYRKGPGTIQFNLAPSGNGHLVMRFFEGAPNNVQALPPGGLTEGSVNVNKINPTAYWQVAPGGISPLNCGTCEYSAAFTANGFGFADYTGTVLVKRSTDGDDWELQGTHVASTGSNASVTVQRLGIANGFSQFALGVDSLNNPLPVTLLRFNAVVQNRQVLLRWLTVSEKNAQHFVVERSFDNRQFNEIGQVAAANRTGQHSYQWLDAGHGASSGVIYYRLKMADADGTYEYSPVAVARFDEQPRLVHGIYPNPVSQGRLQLMLNAAQPLSLEITDVLGRSLRQQIVADGEVLDLAGMARGIYLFRFYNDSQQQLERIEIK